MVSKVADGGPASKEDGLKVQDRILKVRTGTSSQTRLVLPRARFASTLAYPLHDTAMC